MKKSFISDGIQKFGPTSNITLVLNADQYKKDGIRFGQDHTVPEALQKLVFTRKGKQDIKSGTITVPDGKHRKEVCVDLLGELMKENESLETKIAGLRNRNLELGITELQQNIEKNQILIDDLKEWPVKILDGGLIIFLKMFNKFLKLF